jgi:polyhydroxyalkanoate synthesis repressor PhaR
MQDGIISPDHNHEAAMQIIKKYANRKLYHTNRKQYITLDGIAALIQAGERVQVIDNETSEDITAPILAQVAAQPRTGPWPSTGMLADLIRASGDTIAGMSRSLFEGIRGTSLIDEEIAQRIEKARQRGQLDDEQAEQIRMVLLSDQPDAQGTSELPSRSDFDHLRSQVDTLTNLVEQLLNQRKV